MPSPDSKDVYTYTHRGWKFPTLGFALQLHDLILAASEGLPGMKDEGALISALRAPVISAGGQDAYYHLFEKVAALGYLVARNHAFSDGNKRTSLLLMVKTLEWNDYYLQWSDDAEVIIVSLLGAGYLEMEGLRHALLLGCGLDVSDTTL
jgi:death-on-curing protein